MTKLVATTTLGGAAADPMWGAGTTVTQIGVETTDAAVEFPRVGTINCVFCEQQGSRVAPSPFSWPGLGVRGSVSEEGYYGV